jgi:hypothetical protein
MRQLANRRFGVGDHIGCVGKAVILAGMTHPEDIAMHALTSTQHLRSSELSFHAFERVGQSWRGRRSSSFGQVDRTGTPARRDQCPQCGSIAAAPLASSHQGGGAITHHWQCEACALAWDTSFQPLLV